MERFEGQTAVVTGAVGGMGSAIVKELIKRNVNVVGLDTNIEKLKILKEELSKDTQMFKGKFDFKQCNISDVTQIQETFEWINQNFKSLTILVNAAGFGMKEKGLQDMEEIEYDLIFDTNVKGLIFCTKEALKRMMKEPICGHIINICSMAGYDKHSHPFPIYGASKHAVRVFSDALKREICEKQANIKVTNFSPALTETNMSRQFFDSFQIGREEHLDPCDIARACILVLDTPPHVQISDFHIEPLYRTNMNKHAAELKFSQ